MTEQIHSIAPLLAFTDNDRWHPGIGDPTVMGWVTVAAYVAAAVLCWRVAFLARAHAPLEVRKQTFAFWIVFGILMTFLGINKQLDLQTWLTLFGKHLAQDEGWYERRRPVQAVFVGAIGLAGVALLALLGWLTKRTLRQSIVALAGGVFLGCFILIRASSFHSVDELLGTHFGGVKVNWVLELGGIFWITIGAWLNLRRLRHGAPEWASSSSSSKLP